MRTYIVQSDKIVDPFGDYARDCLVRNEPLSELQKRTILELELEPVWVSGPDEIHDPEPYIIINDNLYFTRELLNEFIERSRITGESTVCALKSGLVTLRSVVDVQDAKPCFNDYFEYPLYFSPGGRLRKKYRYIKINPGQDSISIPMPEQVCREGKYSIPITTHFLIQIDHWVNLWAANISTILSDAARLKKMSKLKQLMLVLRARSLNESKILQKLNKIGRKCTIHSTACVENSIIGDNVQIGAGTIVLNSVIGDNVHMGMNVVIDSSIIGSKSLIMCGQIMYSVMFPGVSTSSSRIEVSLIGRGALMGGMTALTDFRFDGENVFVTKDEKLFDTRNKFLGSCLGHGVFLGSGSVVAPGRMIPGGLRITLEDTRIIRTCHLDQDIPGFRLVKK
jgi:carbonic anhydrase/acetyltransferase-like protein (isoleucine patch superfamily)